MFKKSFSSELLRKSPGNLLQNFLRHVLETKSEEELQQKVYNAVMRRSYGSLTLTLLDNNRIGVDNALLVACIIVSGVPVNNVKSIEVNTQEISEKDWEAYYLQSQTGTLIDIAHHFEMDYEMNNVAYAKAEYSPRIYEMLQSDRLQFR